MEGGVEAGPPPVRRVVELDARSAAAPGARLGADGWRRILLAAGLLVEVDGAAALDDRSPLAWVRAVQRLHRELATLEDRLAGLRSLEIRLGGAIPRGFGRLAAVAFLVVAAGIALTRHGFEARLLAWGCAFSRAGTLAALGLLALLAVAGVRYEQRREAILAARKLREEVAAALHEGTRRTLARSFAARAPRPGDGDVLLLSLPHLAWLRSMAGRCDRQASGEASPGVEDPTVLAADLRAAAAAVAAAAEALRASPPADWTEAGLVPPVGVFRRRLDAAGIPRTPEERAWEALLEG